MAKEVFDLPQGSKVALLGWAAMKNLVGGLAFIRLRDGSGYVQVAGRREDLPEASWKELESVKVESAIYVRGAVRDDPRAPGGKEVKIEEFKVIAPAEEWPITRSALKSPSFIFDVRHLSLRGPRTTAIMKIRSEMFRAVFDYFYSHGYHFIQAPLIVQAACEGGATLFPLEYFGIETYLSQSAQLYEEAAICSLEKVFVVQPAFRAEKSKTPRHLTEFWMVEAEVAFYGLEDIMKVEEELVYHMANHIAERCRSELELLRTRLKPPEPPFPKITYDEAREISEKRGTSFEWGEDLPTEAEKAVSAEFEEPFFITGYPVTSRSFYHMPDPSDERRTLSADLLAPGGFGEIATGGQRIHEYDLLYRKVVESGLKPEDMKWYLELRKYGMPPHSGFGIGVERTLRWFLNLKHVREATLFPRTPTRVYP